MGIKIFILLLVSATFLEGCTNFIGTCEYEGNSAEEWYDNYRNSEYKYRSLRECVENLAVSDNYEDLKSIYYSCL